MAKNKFPDNQLNLLNDFDAAENTEHKTGQLQEEESVVDRAIRGIYEKIEAARERRKREDEKKWAEMNLEKIRSEIGAEQPAAAAEEDAKTPSDDYVEPFTPAEEYYGRWNQFRKHKNKK